MIQLYSEYDIVTYYIVILVLLIAGTAITMVIRFVKQKPDEIASQDIADQPLL